MKNNIKLFGLGLLGGLLPLSAFLMLNGSRYGKLSDEVIDGNRYHNAIPASYLGMANAPNFVDASEIVIFNNRRMPEKAPNKLDFSFLMCDNIIHETFLA